MKNIVLIIDWQNRYFVGAPSSEKYMKQAVEKTAAVIKSARQNGDEIVWVAFGNKNQKKETFFTPQLNHSFHPAISELAQESDPFFIKNTSDAFENDDFAQWMSEQSFNKLFFMGFAIQDCVYKTLKTAVKKHPNQCILIRDACGPGPKTLHEYAVKQAFCYAQINTLHGGMTCSSKRVIAHLSHGQALKHIAYKDNIFEYPKNGCEKLHKQNEYLEYPLTTFALIVADRDSSHLRKSKFPKNIRAAWSKKHNIEPDILEKRLSSNDPSERSKIRDAIYAHLKKTHQQRTASPLR